MLVGAATGAIVAGASHAIEFAITGQTEFSGVRIGLSILAGAAGGGLASRIKWSRAQNRAAGNPAAPAEAQPPALPRQNLRQPFQQYYDQQYARGLAEYNNRPNPLLAGNLLFGIVETNVASAATRAAQFADVYAIERTQRFYAWFTSRGVGRSTVGSSAAGNSVRGSGEVGSVGSFFE